MEQSSNPIPEKLYANDPNAQIKEFDLKDGKWVINGQNYYLLQKLPPRRYVEYLKMLPEVVFGTTFEGLYNTLVKCWQSATSGNDVIKALQTVAELSYNQMHALVAFDQRPIPKILQFCAIILVREGEDLAKYDENSVQDKIDDFMADTYSMDSFFLLAKHSVPHLIDVLNKLQSLTNEELQAVAQ